MTHQEEMQFPELYGLVQAHETLVRMITNWVREDLDVLYHTYDSGAPKPIENAAYYDYVKDIWCFL